MFSSVPAATRAALFSSALALSLCSFSAFAADASVADEDVLYETQYSGLAMGTLISARVIAADAATAEKLEAGLADRIEDYETLFTVHRTGPLAEVNRRAGLWTEVDCRIAELAEKAKGVARDRHACQRLENRFRGRSGARAQSDRRGPAARRLHADRNQE